jgi:hypothetical protein
MCPRDINSKRAIYDTRHVSIAYLLEMTKEWKKNKKERKSSKNLIISIQKQWEKYTSTFTDQQILEMQISRDFDFYLQYKPKSFQLLLEVQGNLTMPIVKEVIHFFN